MKVITKKHKSGFTLIETVVFVGIFGILAILSTSVVFIILGTMAKSRIVQDVRRNGDNAIQVMERQLRVAKSVSTASGTCGGSMVPSNTISYVDQYGSPLSFTCTESVVGGVASSWISSMSATTQPLTDSSKVKFSHCFIFDCDRTWVTVDFTLGALSSSSRATEQFQSRWQTQINLRYR